MCRAVSHSGPLTERASLGSLPGHCLAMANVTTEKQTPELSRPDGTGRRLHRTLAGVQWFENLLVGGPGGPCQKAIG